MFNFFFFIFSECLLIVKNDLFAKEKKKTKKIFYAIIFKAK